MPTPTKSRNSPPPDRTITHNFRYSLRSRRQLTPIVPTVEESTSSISRDSTPILAEVEEIATLSSEVDNFSSDISISDHVVHPMDPDPVHVAANLCFVHIHNTSEPAHVATLSPSLSPSPMVSLPASVTITRVFC